MTCESASRLDEGGTGGTGDGEEEAAAAADAAGDDDGCDDPLPSSKPILAAAIREEVG